MKNKEKKRNARRKRTTLWKEFLKRFIPILVGLSILLTLFLYSMYKQVVNNAERVFDRSISDMEKVMEETYLYMLSDRGLTWDDKDVEDFERSLAITISNYGTTGNLFMDENGLMLRDNFTDFAFNLFRDNFPGDAGNDNRYELIKDTEDYVYMVEQRGTRTDPSLRHFYRIYACDVDEMREAFEFQLQHRHTKDPFYGPSGFATLDSFYINYKEGTLKPKQFSLYNVVRDVDYQGLREYSRTNQEVLEKTVICEPSDIDGDEYVDIYDEDFHESFFKKGRYFFGPFIVSSEKGGEADLVLQDDIRRHMKRFDSMGGSTSHSRTHHGMVLEYSELRSLTFSPLNYEGYSKDVEDYFDADDKDAEDYFDTDDKDAIDYFDTDDAQAGDAQADDAQADDTQADLQLINEIYTVQATSVPEYQYISCVAATMDLREIYGTRVAIYYGLMLLVSILSALLLARRTFFKMNLQYQMIDYRKALTEAMAHDLKTPLMAVSGYAENLKENIYTEQRDVYADKILENVDYMNQIVSDVLELSKSEEEYKQAELKPLNLRKLAEDTFAKYDSIMSTRNLFFTMEGELEQVCDQRMMSRVFDNLIGNAVTYCLDGREIAVIFHKNEMTIRNSFDKKSFDFDQDLQKLTNPFVKGCKSRTNHKGSGLGLAIAKELLSTQGFSLTLSIEDGDFITTVKG